jgi:phosphoribosyl 1,2-cyclic phosphate phosphodiesterase
VRLRFLGTGTSFGIPVIGCDCAVCRSSDARNRRTRHGLLLREGPRRLLVDTPPELRLQLVAAGVDGVDAVFLSHPHADHLHGIDDLRGLAGRRSGRIPFHVAAEYEAELRSRFPYFLGPDRTSQPGMVVPEIELVPFADRDTIDAAGFELRVVGAPHGAFTSYGFRCGDLTVIIDGKRVPVDAVPLLEGSRTLVINALWHGSPHPAHFNVEEALEVVERLRPERAFLTHLTHGLDHETLLGALPSGVQPAHDGLEIDV